jgi:hypothetical protein
VWDLGDTASEFTVQTSAAVVTQAGQSWTIPIQLLGSMDGVNWVTLPINPMFGGQNEAPSLTGGSNQTSETSLASSPSVYSSGASNPAVRYVRLSIVPNVVGLTSYSVDGWIALGASVA